MSKSKLSIGIKLSAAFGLMLSGLGALTFVSLSSFRSMSREFDNVAGAQTQKLDLAASVAADSEEMASLERGAILRVTMRQMNRAEEVHRAFLDANKRAAGQIAALKALSSGEDRRSIEALESALAAWPTLDDALWQAARKRRTRNAFKILDQQTLPLSDQANRSAQEIVRAQKSQLTEAIARGRATASHTRWVTMLLGLLFGAIGAIGFWMVRRFSRDLARMSAELSESAEQIAAAAVHVTASSQSLAQGASAQAASLEQTSASTEEITAMTRRNAENSRAAADVMTTVDQHVKEGNRTLEQMLVSMQEITDSSGKISKIIKVIEEIAFQTNILALNAAVEAARAGDAGLGFAVVAGEVRNLAQRSSQAAKDTASLIEDSIAKSNQGGATLKQVTGVIRAITGSASKVKTLVDEVNMGSQEQARGIDRISKAVTHMDSVTQGAAASAAESASASEELSAQTQGLREVLLRLHALAGSGEREMEIARPVAVPHLPKLPLAPVAEQMARRSLPLDEDFAHAESR